MPNHGDKGTCSECERSAYYLVHSQSNGAGGYEVLDAWWAHEAHPLDDHEAVVPDAGR